MDLPTSLLAHAGGVDEILIFAAPVLLLYLGMRWWDRRQDGEED